MMIIYDGTFYVEDMVESVEWSGDIEWAYRMLQITLTDTIDGISPVMEFQLGREIRFYGDEDAELFRGFIFERSIDGAGRLTLMCYDEGVYLTKNRDTRKFVAKTATQIIRSLCEEFGIATGTIAETSYVIPKLILRDMELGEMMYTAITETKDATGRTYYLYTIGGRLNLVERSARKAAYMIESNTNMLSASYTQSIVDLRNQVRVIGGKTDENPIIAVEQDAASIARFGLMQHLEYADAEANTAEIRRLAQQRLTELNVIGDEASIESIGYDDTYAGVSVYVYDKMTGIIGSYYVSSDTHTYGPGIHTMSLTLSATDDLPLLQYEPPAGGE